MGSNYDTVASRWIDMVLGRDTRRPPKNERMYASNGGDELYSYGSHFTLVQALRDKKRNVTGFLLNGDRYSNTTSGHQAVVRSVVARSGIPSVIIPFEALHSASIDTDTIEIVDVLPDRHVVTRKTFTEVQPSWQWRDVPTYASRDKTTEELQAIVDRRNADALQRWEEREQWAHEEVQRGVVDGYWTRSRRPQPQPLTIDDLGDYERASQVHYVASTTRTLFAGRGRFADEVEITYVGGEPIEYTVESRRHWLGESLVRAKVNYTRVITCRECNGFNTRPYAPAPGEVPTYWRNAGWEDVDAQEAAWLVRVSRCPRCSHGREVVHRTRTATFLSGFDHNERREVYFFSELPDNKALTVEEAYESLKPDTVKIAEQMGREVLRQGDIFAVPMVDLDKRALRSMGARFERRGGLLGTNHVATEVAYLKDGRTLARGTLTHAPDGRRPDHARVTMPKNVWHLTIKNTVPLTR